MSSNQQQPDLLQQLDTIRNSTMCHEKPHVLINQSYSN